MPMKKSALEKKKAVGAKRLSRSADRSQDGLSVRYSLSNNDDSYFQGDVFDSVHATSDTPADTSALDTSDVDEVSPDVFQDIPQDCAQEIFEHEVIGPSQDLSGGQRKECFRPSRRIARAGLRDITTAIRKALARCDEDSEEASIPNVFGAIHAHGLSRSTEFDLAEQSAQELKIERPSLQRNSTLQACVGRSLQPFTIHHLRSPRIEGGGTATGNPNENSVGTRFLACLRESLVGESREEREGGAGVQGHEATFGEFSPHHARCDLASTASIAVGERPLLVRTGLAFDAICGGLVCGAIHELRDVADQAASVNAAGDTPETSVDWRGKRVVPRVVPFGIIAHLACCALAMPEIGGDAASHASLDVTLLEEPATGCPSRRLPEGDDVKNEHATVVWIGDRVRPSNALLKAFEGHEIQRPAHLEFHPERDRPVQAGDDGVLGNRLNSRRILQHSLASCSIFIRDTEERVSETSKRRAYEACDERLRGTSLRPSSSRRDFGAYSKGMQSRRQRDTRIIGGRLNAPQLRVWSAEHFLKSASPAVAPVLVLVVTSESAHPHAESFTGDSQMKAGDSRWTTRWTKSSRSVATRWDVRASATVHFGRAAKSMHNACQCQHGCENHCACCGDGTEPSNICAISRSVPVPDFAWTMTLRELRGRAAVAMASSACTAPEMERVSRVTNTETLVIAKEKRSAEQTNFDQSAAFCHMSAIEDGAVQGTLLHKRAAFGEQAWAIVSAKASAKNARKESARGQSMRCHDAVRVSPEIPCASLQVLEKEFISADAGMYGLLDGMCPTGSRGCDDEVERIEDLAVDRAHAGLQERAA